MLIIEDAVFPSADQWDIIVKAVRNPKNSWDRSDSEFGTANWCDYVFNIGYNDLSLMENLSKAGTDHGKFLRMIPVFITINAPLYFYKEMDTYKVGTTCNSCSTMHKIHSKEFSLDDFSREHIVPKLKVMLNEDENMCFSIGKGPDRESDLTDVPFSTEDVMKFTIKALNHFREKYLETKDKKYWWQMIQLLPSSYNQKRTYALNYAVLKNIYHARKNHKLDEWKTFCEWIESEVPYAEELIICE